MRRSSRFALVIALLLGLVVPSIVSDMALAASPKVKVGAKKEVLEADGGAVVTFAAKGFNPAESVTATTTLTAACGAEAFGSYGSNSGSFTADANGILNGWFVATACPAGAHTLTLSGASSGAAVGKIELLAAAVANKPSLKTAAKSQKATLTGIVDTTVLIRGLVPGASYILSSSALDAACGNSPFAFAVSNDPGDSLPLTASADSNGNANLALTAQGCSAGSFTVHLVSGATTLATKFKVKAP